MSRQSVYLGGVPAVVIFIDLRGTAEQLLNEPRIAGTLTSIDLLSSDRAEMFADKAVKEGKTRSS